MTPGIGMCATKRKMTSIAKTNSSFARTSGCAQESIIAWSRRGALRLLSGVLATGHLLGSSELSSALVTRLRRECGGGRAAFGSASAAASAAGSALPRQEPRLRRRLVRGTRRAGASVTSFTLRSSVSVTLPPAASIFAFALAEKRSASTVSATLISPSPRIFTGMRSRLDDAGRAQALRRHARAGGEPAQLLDVDRLVLDAEAVVEAAQARERADERVLATLEADTEVAAATGLLALDTAAGVGAVTAGVTAADALLLVDGARVRGAGRSCASSLRLPLQPRPGGAPCGSCRGSCGCPRDDGLVQLAQAQRLHGQLLVLLLADRALLQCDLELAPCLTLPAGGGQAACPLLPSGPSG